MESIFHYAKLEDAECRFALEAREHGVEAVDVNYEDGYLELEDGTSICLTTSNPIE